MSSHIFNIQNTFAVTSAIQGIQAAAVGESAVQHSYAVEEQQARIAEKKLRVARNDESAATVDLSQNESSQRSIYTPLPRKHKGEAGDEADGDDDGDGGDVRHIDITA